MVGHPGATGAQALATISLGREHLPDWSWGVLWGKMYVSSQLLLALASSPACLEGGREGHFGHLWAL